MSIEWAKGPPPEGAFGTWLVWIEGHGARFARRDIRNRLFVIDNSTDHPAGWWEARITHYCPCKITRPVTEG